MSWTNVSTRLALAVSFSIMLSGCNSEPPVAEAKVRAKPRRTSPSSALPGAVTTAPQSASTSDSSAPAPAPTALASTVPIASPTTPAPPILPKVKKVDASGAVVENLGPCHGRGIAGEATINGRKEYICGDGSRAYLNDTGYYGKNSKYNKRRQNTNYGGYSNSNYPPPQRRVITYVP